MNRQGRASNFLIQLRTAYGLPIASFQAVYTVDIRALDDAASRIVRGAMKVAAAQGAGFAWVGSSPLFPT